MILKNLHGSLIKSALMCVAAAFSVPVLNAAFPSGYFTSQSLFGTGRWVKIKVRENGIHQITDGELRAMGFDDPAKVAVYGYSGLRMSDHRLSSDLPDDIPAVPCVRHGNKLLFYGEGDAVLRVQRTSVASMPGDLPVLDRNFFATYGVYFLTDSHPAATPAEVAYTPTSASPLTTSFGLTLYEKEVENAGGVGARYHDVDFNKQPVQKCVFDMPGFNGAGAVNMELMLGMRLNTSSSVVLELPDGSTTRTPTVWSLSQQYFSYQGASSSYSVKNVVPSADGNYSLTLDFSSLSGSGALDYFTVLYPRDNVMTSGQDCFVFPRINATASVRIRLSGTEAMVWDCSDRYMPRVMQMSAPDADGFVTVASPGYFDVSDANSRKEARLVAFDPAAELLSVEYVGEVANHNLHGCDTPNMLVVTAKEFLPQAERLARAHREADGIDVVVAVQDDVYDEFSGGNPHLMGIRRMAKMFHDRDAAKFRSILLIGGAHYDNRAISLIDERTFRHNYIPIFECEDAVRGGNHSYSYGTDAYVGMLSENSGNFDVLKELMTVNVGRIPARNVESADGYVDKAVDYIKNPPVSDFHNRVLLLSHHGDGNSHMHESDTLASLILDHAPQTTVFKAYASLFPLDGSLAIPLNRRMETVLSKGVSFWGYSGHGGPDAFGYAKFLTLDMARNMSYEVPPFVMFATCRSLYMDHPGDNIGSELLFNRHGGAIGVVGALREVYQEQNQILNVNIGDAFFSAQEGACIGDVFRVARNRAVSEAGTTNNSERLVLNTLCYNFVGDPEIKQAVPAYKVELTRIGDCDVDGTEVSVPSYRVISVEGKVLTASGEAAQDFAGEMFLSVYGGERKLPVVNGSGAELNELVSTDEDLIYEKRFPVKGGVFSGTVYLPVSGMQSGANRFTFYALSTDGKSQGVGRRDNLFISGTNPRQELDDTTVPVITDMYLNDETFADGDLMDGNVTLYARVAPNEIGVTGMCSLIGQSVALSLDGGRSTYADVAGSFNADDMGGGELEYALGDLTDGKHTLTLRVSNYAGQSASRTISFEVVNKAAECELAVAEYPASSVATIDLRHNFSEEPVGRVVIKNGAGEVVFSRSDVSFPYVWNLTDSDGREVQEGVFTVEAYLKGGNRYGGTIPVELVVNRD